jgi:hypothetical protein
MYLYPRLEVVGKRPVWSNFAGGDGDDSGIDMVRTDVGRFGAWVGVWTDG